MVILDKRVTVIELEIRRSLVTLAHAQIIVSYMGRDPSTMGHFDNVDNELLNKYKKNLKNRK
jgi:hypothetical protein